MEFSEIQTYAAHHSRIIAVRSLLTNLLCDFMFLFYEINCFLCTKRIELLHRKLSGSSTVQLSPIKFLNLNRDRQRTCNRASYAMLVTHIFYVAIFICQKIQHRRYLPAERRSAWLRLNGQNVDQPFFKALIFEDCINEKGITNALF